MTIQPFRAVYPNFDLIRSPDEFFATIKQEFPDYWENGFFLQDEDDAMFVYHIVSPKHRHVGLISSLSIHDYLDGKIKRHEDTLATKEQKMTKLLLQRKAMIKPVLLTYRPEPEIAQLLEECTGDEPFFEVLFDEVERHILYKVTDPELLLKLQSLFYSKIGEAYIADGHHRFVTSAKLYKAIKPGVHTLDFGSVLTVLFPFDQVIIHDYNRVVEILHEITPTMFMARLAAVCDIVPLKKAKKPGDKFELSLYINSEWYMLHWKPEVIEKYKDNVVILDGDILNGEVLDQILGITDVREDTRLKYVEGIAGIEGVTEKVHKNTYRIGFCLYPVDIEEIVRMSDSSRTLPPKTTWFEPRIKNGLIAQAF